MSRLLSSIRLRTSRFVQASEQMEHMPVAICVGLSSLLCGPGIGEDGRLFLLKSELKSRHYTVFFLLKSSVVSGREVDLSTFQLNKMRQSV